MRKTQITRKFFKKAKGLAKTSQQTLIILKIGSKTDLKRNKFIVFKMKDVLQTYNKYVILYDNFFQKM